MCVSAFGIMKTLTDSLKLRYYGAFEAVFPVFVVTSFNIFYTGIR